MTAAIVNGLNLANRIDSGLKRVAAAVATALFVACLSIPSAHAQEPVFVEQARDWDVFTTTIEGSKACFIVSKARTYDPMPESRHGDVFFYMTRRPAAGVDAEPLLLVGYSFREGSQVNVSVGGSNFPFLTQGPRAFLNDPGQGSALLAAMRAGSSMRVTGTSSRGTAVTYGFSLSGVTAGTNRTASDCSA
ncbi:MAG: invasion associated locus B family protein [Pseudomonadota bacterium]